MMRFCTNTTTANTTTTTTTPNHFTADEDGSVTIWAMGWTVVFLLVGGLAVDVGNAWRVQGMLQSTADVAALSGAIELLNSSDTAARAEAIRIANLNMPEGVVVAADVISGSWNSSTRIINTNATVKDTLRVTARRSGATDNPLPTFLIKLAGITSWDVAAQATVQRFVPGCIRDGLVARGQVEVSSNNAFVDGICLHGETGVKISSNNSFEAGVKVTMPDLDMLQIPASGLTSNVGLADALGEDNLDPKIVDHVGEIVTALANPAYTGQPIYINRTLAAIAMTRATFNAATSLTAGRVYSVNCTGGSGININASVVTNVVVTTNCKVSFSANSVVSNAVIATSSTATTSVSGSSSSTIGANDNCAAGGGAQVLTAGSIHFASGLNLYGSQMIAVGDVTIAANAEGIKGASIQAGGDIKLTSNTSFGQCSDNVDVAFYRGRYHLVQ